MPRTKGAPSKRRHDLDNLRTFLTALVIYHHTAIIYGGPGSWLFKSRFFTRGSLALVPFNFVDQSFFMGLFFWLSGLLSGNRLSDSPTKESRWSFLRSKWFHLGLPAVIYTVMIHPLSLFLASSLGSNLLRSSVDTTFSNYNYWKQLRSVRGPVWYLATLLSFDTLATLCLPYTKSKVIQFSLNFISSRLAVPSLWLTSTASTFILRLFWPVGTALPLVAVQPAFLPQYVLSYTLGLLSSFTEIPQLFTPWNKNKTLRDDENFSSESHIEVQTPDHGTNLPIQSPAVPIGLSFSTFPLIFSRNIFSSPNTNSSTHFDPVSLIGGGFTVPAFLYTVWNEMSFSLIGPSLLNHFSRFYNYRVKSTSIFYPRYSYAAFLVHTPITVLLGVGADRLLALIAKDRALEGRYGRMIMPVMMTAIVGTGNVLGSFVLGKFLVDYMPGVGQIV